MFVGLMGRRSLDTGKKKKKTQFNHNSIKKQNCISFPNMTLCFVSTPESCSFYFPEMEDDWNSGAY